MTEGAGELLESLDRHFLACPTLNNSQLAQHRESGTCPDCGEAATMPADLRASRRPLAASATMVP